MSAPPSSNKDKLVLVGASLPVTEAVAALLHGGPVGMIVALGVSGLVYVVADEIESRGGELPLPRPSPRQGPEDHRQRQAGRPHGMMYKMLNGKSIRGDVEEADWQEDDQDHDDEDDQDDFDTGDWNGNTTLAFSDLLARGWRPSMQQIFLARLDDGTDVFVPVSQLVHIAFAGSTRQGKTSIIRYLLAQLCFVGCTCMLLDPHYTPYDIETDEDWTPYLPYLRFAPTECKDYGQMEKLLHYTATTLLDARKRLREQTRPVGKHIFLFLDEYPAIIAERPSIQKDVAKLLREGAKYNIHLAIASQDFQVKTVSPQAGGAIRESYKTVFYVGGDKTTANVLLDTPVSPQIEASLGKGPIMLRCATIKQAALAHTPWTDNQALYALLGPSTYQPVENEDEEAATDEDGEGEASAFEAIDHQADAQKKLPQLLRLPTQQQQLPQRQEPVLPKAVVPEKGRKAEEIDLSRAIAIWNALQPSVKDLEEIFGLTNHQARRLREMILKQADAVPPEQKKASE
jgi:hypothetical protein